ncbi:unnamed protein product [Cladocopium goreaui]|uniref:non-specific serine/threonine protein kinase n=1 Tax=Cladocopium goreaui TaxID=2562237 RepID=A0A9P1M2R9_9DINO|nr:unnamed protein product [Cladocopium goreaui]
MPQSSVSSVLIEWHRKRRRLGTPLERNDSADGETNLAEKGASRNADLSAFPCSPVVCPSPAEFERQDLVRKNVRQIDAEYEFKEVLGEGSFGKVHKAQHRRTGILRAVKEIPQTGGDDDFELELKALQALDHPHIVEVIEYFDDISSFFLVMELCTGLGNGAAGCGKSVNPIINRPQVITIIDR